MDFPSTAPGGFGIAPGINSGLGQLADGDDAYISDVSMAADSDVYATDDSIYDPAAALLNETDNTHGDSTRKRKSASPAEQSTAKRVRRAGGEESLQRDRARQLPAGIWHHIFTFLDPRALGGLLLVNKLFHACLDPSAAVKTSFPPVSPTPIVPLLKPDAIWQASRRHFWPKMPAPLKTRSELGMWRIACSRACQFCKTRGPADAGATADQWHRGPGAKGVSPVFPFFLVSCGNCLREKSLKVSVFSSPALACVSWPRQEIDILLSSSTPSVLLQGLPVVFMTSEQHVISPLAISSGGIPPTGQVIKMYWPGHVEGIKHELETVKSLGPAAAEEWFKGLEVRGKNALADASRWERWSRSGGIHRMRDPLPSVPPGAAEKDSIVVSDPLSHQKPGHSMDAHVLADGVDVDPIHPAPLPKLKGEAGTVFAEPRARTQQKRTREEVGELKAKRRAEIERRALLLDPPLSANVLAHMSSFQAALHIIAPVDDKAWELLKPRLAAQRAVAEQQVKGSVESTHTPQERHNPVPAEADASVKMEVTDEEWDEIQGPVRARISAYADEIIGDEWKDGERVTKKTAPQFAADSLLYVRKRFYAEVAKDAATAIALGKQPVIDPPQGPFTQKLTLENMKWVFDMKIKQHTEHFHRKELFCCNGNACPVSSKLYGFEGVIQHYAAKHTSALSMGSVVVHWRAEWPEEPVFNPHPRRAAAARAVSTKDIQPPQGPAMTPNGQPGHGALPPVVFPLPPQGPPDGYYGYAAQTPYTVPAAFGPAPVSSASHAPPQLFAQDASFLPYQQGLPHSAPFQPEEHTPGYTNNAAQFDPSRNSHRGYEPVASSHEYRIRLQLMAKIAKETWVKTANIKGLQGVVKVCVAVHHIAKKFQNDFSEAASLAMFIDGLSNEKDMRPVRNVDALSCKACSLSGRVEGKKKKKKKKKKVPEKKNKTFSLPQLAKHFNTEHVEAVQTRGLAPMDWRVDMLLLPDQPLLGDVRYTLKQNNRAYEMVRDTIPWAFVKTEHNATEKVEHVGTAVPDQHALSGHAVEEEDDHYSPPMSIEPSNGRDEPDGWSARKPRSPTVENTTNLNKPAQWPPNMEPPISQSHAQPSNPRTHASAVPNLQPASVVYDKNDSQRFLRPARHRQGDMGPPGARVEITSIPRDRPDARVKRTDMSSRPGDDGKLFVGRSEPAQRKDVKMSHGEGRAVQHLEQGGHPRAPQIVRDTRQRDLRGAHPREIHPSDVYSRDAHPGVAHLRYPRDGHPRDAPPREAHPREAHLQGPRSVLQQDAHSRQPHPQNGFQPLQRWEDDAYRQGRVAARPAARVARSRPPDSEPYLLDTPHMHPDVDHRDAPRVDPRLDMRQGTAAPEYPHHSVRYVDDRGYALDERHQSVSPRYAAHDPYAHGQYRERSSVPRHQRPVYRDESQLGYGAHQDDLLHRQAPPMEVYEILEVIDPRGNYLIRRPIRRDPGDGYAYDARPPTRAAEPLPRRLPPPADDRRPIMYDDAPRPAGALERTRSRPDLEEYDPHFPAAAGAGSSSRQLRS